ncbi:protein-(glutamine-N5) methyltransferase, release factor-specific [Alteromonas lipolytica]|uniref:Release factor glutamine methyltransferase n=2 Tax=Alteromonas lipolytica TaxID=1856405 RepID=A0A1E8FHW7_9ALTE|nr:peptide chain release factor N(5)-glutamine methyltransferase [Alteromonas lipolytica]OFI35336.1 protein-(glutamine-N5) methyltransferase, release factor-specific [Alteromonas lipolytica]
MNISQALSWATTQLSDGESPLVDSRVLLCAVLDCNRSYLFTWPDKALSDDQLTTFKQLVQKRQQGHPVAYLIGSRAFWTLTLKVNESTLIPRPETELLVETALQLPLPTAARICDLGTGTGAIALALAAEKPQWSVTGVDRVEAALQLAKENASLNGNLQVNWLLSHWFNDLPATAMFDLIVTNPPYVETGSVYLQQGDVRFEPASALTAGADGLADIREIISQAPDHLSLGGWLLIEHGYTQHDAIKALLQQRGFTACQGVDDLNGMPRITLAKWHKS